MANADTGLGHARGVCLGDHRAITDEDDMLDPEALPHAGDRVGDGRLVLRRSWVHRDRDRPALGGGQVAARERALDALLAF